MSEEKKNMEDLLQSELDLGDTEAVGAADDPFANIGANDDPFAGVNGTEDTFVDIENDNNNPFNDVAAEKTTEAGEMTAEGTGTGSCFRNRGVGGCSRKIGDDKKA